MSVVDRDDLPAATLYVVSTPIGNLKDITLRAIEVLQHVDLIAAEDTRHTRILLNRYQISTPTTSYFDFNKEKKLPALLEKLKAGQRLALVSDAGTPGISDPGFKLIRACIENDIHVETIPGATALIPAIVMSGLATDRFTFEGFLPVKKGRKTRLEQLRDEPRTMVFYESPHRILRTLKQLLEFLGDRRAVVARELTKKFEQVYRGTLAEFSEQDNLLKLKGEFVVIVEGKGK